MDVKLNVKSVFKTDTSDKEKFIEKFNLKLLKVILNMEFQVQGGNG